MNTIVIAFGLVGLVAFAIIIGTTVDRQSQKRAWRSIAFARRRNHEYHRGLQEFIAQCRKTDCPLRAALDPPSEEPPLPAVS